MYTGGKDRARGFGGRVESGNPGPPGERPAGREPARGADPPEAAYGRQKSERRSSARAKVSSFLQKQNLSLGWTRILVRETVARVL